MSANFVPEHQWFVGIDPGLTGAVAAINPWLPTTGITLCWDTPTYKDGTRNRVDIPYCMDILVNLRDNYGIRRATIEKVQPMPKNGSLASFSLGHGFGVWCALLTSLGIAYQMVRPVEWKKAMQIPAGSDKKHSAVRALELFPDAELMRTSRCSVPSDGRADAILIAEYGRQKTGVGK